MDNSIVVLALILSLVIACVLISLGIVKRSRKERETLRRVLQNEGISRHGDDIILLWSKPSWKRGVAGTIIFGLIGCVLIYYNESIPLVTNIIWIIPLLYYVLRAVFGWPNRNKVFFLVNIEKIEIHYLDKNKPSVTINWNDILKINITAPGYGGIAGLEIRIEGMSYFIYDIIQNFPQFCRQILDNYNLEALSEMVIQYLQKEARLINYSPMEWP